LVPGPVIPTASLAKRQNKQVVLTTTRSSLHRIAFRDRHSHMPIHSTAIIDPQAEVDPSVDVGPYVVIDGTVRIGQGTRILAHAVLTGWTDIGEDNEIHMGAVIGHTPQDFTYKGEQSFLKIGHRNIIREQSQIHRGAKAGSATIIGDDNYLMQHAHIAHNCTIGNHTIIAGGALLAGYVHVEDRAFISGNCVVHQFVRIGTLALLRGLSRTSRDVPPFCIMDGTHTVRGLNAIGLRRAGFSRERISTLKQAFSTLFRTRGNIRNKVEQLQAASPSEDVGYLLDFIHNSERGVCFGPKTASNGKEEG